LEDEFQILEDPLWINSSRAIHIIA
jgi:hypothetical protein